MNTETEKSKKALVTVFGDLDSAERVIEKLFKSGFPKEQIELVAHHVADEAPEIETPKDHETTESSLIDAATKWGGVGTGAGLAAGLFVPFPGLALGMAIMGGVTGAIMGGIAGVDHAVTDDSVELPTLDEYEQLVKNGDKLVVILGSHEQKRGRSSLFSQLIDFQSVERYIVEMPRRPRICPAGTCFHVINRSVARLTLFEKQQDYEAFLEVLELTYQKVNLPIFGYAVMPNHWHFVVQPKTKTQVTEFFRWLTHTHTMRWHAHYHTEGTGHLYQGRFKTFPIEEDQHLLAVLRYVERNPLRASLCEKAEDWKYTSLWRRSNGDQHSPTLLSDWPIPRPRQWISMVNRPQNENEENAIRKSLKKGCPYGSKQFVSQSAVRLKLEHTLRSRGRPKKQ